MQSELILQPFVAMMLLTLVVWVRLYFTRLPQITRRGINPQKLATRDWRTNVDLGSAEVRTSDNFQNQFELPVLFYAVSLALFVTGAVDTTYLVLGWCFVALRALHAFIHLFYNRVLHRFLAYVAGGAVLFMMILRFSKDLFS